MNKVAPLDYQLSAITMIKPQDLIKKPTDSTKVCKICLEEELTDLDILIHMTESELSDLQLMVPCECSGSMGYVHQKCIRTWIQKQVLNTNRKEVCCQICKAQLYFIISKQKYCQCSCKNLSLISGCSILTATLELFLLIVSILILRYSADIVVPKMVSYVLIVLICIFALAFALTAALMVSQAFIKSKKEISKIFSLQQSQQLGFREIRVKTSNNLARSIRNLPRTTNHIPQRLLKRNNGKNKVANLHYLVKNCPQSSHFPFIEVNPSATGHNL